MGVTPRPFVRSRSLESLRDETFDLVVVGGGVSRKAEKFLPLLKLRTPIIPAKLENTAGIVGAAALAADDDA